jgi:glyoxylase-like metal-dependent hydrolase (beta-lactamase superfamily II)/rhodanese-related sulfurtransferase
MENDQTIPSRRKAADGETIVMSARAMNERKTSMLVKQLRSGDGSGTLSYLIVDEKQRVGCVIDPNIEDLPELEAAALGMKTSIISIIDTHTHADHVSAAGELRKRTGAETIMHSNTRNKWKFVDQGEAFGIADTLRANAAIPIDRYVDDGDVVQIGSFAVKILFTPGHTDNHITPLIDANLFTGDLLLIGQAGRSDLPGGNPGEQYDSLFAKILPLPDQSRVYPGHDYEGNEFSYLGDERRTNPFLQLRSKEQFVAFVKEFFPPLSEKAATGGKMTLQCGVQRIETPGEKVRSVTAQELRGMQKARSDLFLLDVREPYEILMNGAIEGVTNVPIGDLKKNLNVLPTGKDVTIVCVCQSGSRSVEAAHYLQQLGYVNVLNLAGGTSGWREFGFPVARATQRVT